MGPAGGWGVWRLTPRSRIAVAVVVVMIAAVAACHTTPLQAWRRIAFARTLFTVRDHVADFRSIDRIFPVRAVPAGAHASALEAGAGFALPPAFTFDGERVDTASFLQDTDTTGLIVIKDDAIVYEHYFRGASAATRTIGWSLSKSFLSALVGIAIGEGRIHDIGDPVTAYAPELAGSAYDGVRLKDVLQMSSGARWSEDYGDPDSDINRFGRAVALGRSFDALVSTLRREHPPGTFHRYNTLDTQALAIVLRHATGMPLASYLSSRLWQPLGMDSAAYYLTDDGGTEFAAGGLNATLRDFARFGLLYEHEGEWHGVQRVPRDWVRASVRPDAPHLMPGKRASSDEAWGYGYQWWVPDLDGDYCAVGIFNQFIYVDPREHLVIAKVSANHRYGTGRGDAEPTDHEQAHIALFKEIGRALLVP